MIDTEKFLVRSKYGKTVTLQKHFADVVEYFEENKKKALEATQDNSQLYKFLQTLGVFVVANTEKEHDVSIGIRKGNNILLENSNEIRFSYHHAYGVGSNIHSSPKVPDMAPHFGEVKEMLLQTIVYDFFYPRLIKNKKVFIQFIEWLIKEELKWDIQERSKYEGIDIFISQYAIPSDFTLFSAVKVLLLIGSQKRLEQNALKIIQDNNPSEVFIVSSDGIKSQVEKLIADIQSIKSQYANKINAWSKTNLSFVFFLGFRDLASFVSEILNLSISKVYTLGEELSITVGSQHELIEELRNVKKGKGVEFESVLEKVLNYCLREEFSNFKIEKQVSNYQKKSRRDFILYNDSPKVSFWTSRLNIDKVEIILFEAKNYTKKLTARDLYQTQAYLVNNIVFGNFALILSREGFNDQDYLSSLANQKNSQKIIVLNEEDLIEMIENKAGFKSPTDVILERYRKIISKI